MALFEWTIDLSVGIEEFDSHHKRLVHLINTLHESLIKGQETEATGEVLTELSNYTIYHFFAEEDAMELHKFPGRIEHRDEHILMTDKTITFLRDYDAGKPGLAKGLLEFLVEWLKHHILETDKEYGPFLNERGVL